MSKTPYELRFDVLQMARDLCMDEYHQNANAFWQLHAQLEQKIERIDDTSQLDKAVDSLQAVADKLLAIVPSMPTSDQIMIRARELYQFVENK